MVNEGNRGTSREEGAGRERGRSEAEGPREGGEGEKGAKEKLNDLKEELNPLKVGVEQFLGLSKEMRVKAVLGKSVEELKNGSEAMVQFGVEEAGGRAVNTALEHAIGLKDLIPPGLEFGKVRVFGDEGEIIGYRKGYAGSFYTESGNYVKIMDGYKVRFEPYAEPNKFEEEKKDYETNLGNYTEILKNSGLTEEAQKFLAERCAEVGIDPRLVLVLSSVRAKYAGEAIQGQIAETEIAIKFTQNALMKLVKEKGKDYKVFAEKLCAESFSFVLNRFNLMANVSPMNDVEIKELANNYAKVIGEGDDFVSKVVESGEKDAQENFGKSSIDDSQWMGNGGEDKAERTRNSGRARPVEAGSVYSGHANKMPNLELNPSNVQKMGVRGFLEKWRDNKEKYREVAEKVNLPAELIAAIHYRESGGRFNTYLHNGDPLGKPTVHVPKGILFDNWEDAAVHALTMGNFRRVAVDVGLNKDSKDMAAMATFAEYYNGLGYRNKGMSSPYVYAGTNQYEKGKYVADRQFSAEHVDQQPGVLLLIQSAYNFDKNNQK